MRVDCNNLPDHLHNNITVYVDGVNETFGCVMADDRFNIVKRYVVEDGSFVIDHKKQRVKTEFKRGDVTICNNWEMESRKIQSHRGFYERAPESTAQVCDSGLV